MSNLLVHFRTDGRAGISSRVLKWLYLPRKLSETIGTGVFFITPHLPSKTAPRDKEFVQLSE